MIFDLFGWLGSAMLAICGLPQAFQSWREGHSNGISHGLIWLWFGGEILTLTYVLWNKDWPLVFNYASNVLILIPIAYFKLCPRKPIS